MPFLLDSKIIGIYIILNGTPPKVVHISEDVHPTYDTWKESSPANINFQLSIISYDSLCE